MMKMLNGEMDMASMLGMLPQLLEGGNVKDLLLKFAGSYLDSSPYGPMIQMYGKQAMDSPQAKAFLDGAWDYTEAFVKTENGRRFLKLVPQLVAAKDFDAMLLLVSKEAEVNWGQFFGAIQNSDYRKSAMEATAGYLVQGYEFVQNPPRDSMVTKLPILINGVLVSQRLPTIDLANPVESLTKIANKAIKVFTTWRVDIRPHVAAVRETLEAVYQKQAKGNTFAELSSRASLVPSAFSTAALSLVISAVNSSGLNASMSPPLPFSWSAASSHSMAYTIRLNSPTWKRLCSSPFM